MRPPYYIRARDPKTHRTMERTIAAAAAETTDPPWFLSNLIEEIAAGINRSWFGRYGVQLPTGRIEWQAGQTPPTPEPERMTA